MQDIGISSAPSGADLIAVAKGGRSAKQDDGAGKGFQDALTSSLGNGGKSGANANGDAGTVGTGADTDIDADGAAAQPANLAAIVSATGDGIDTGAEMIDPSLANLANPATLTKGAKPSVGAKFPQEASAANLSKSLMDLQQAVPDDTATADTTKTTGDADTTQPQVQIANQLDDLAQQLAEVVVGDPSVKTDGDGKATPVKTGKTLPVADDGKSLTTQNAQTGSAVSDVLSLLNTQQAAVAPQSAAAVFTGADVKTQATPDQSLPKIANVATKDTSVDTEDTMAALPGTGDDTAAAQTFRLVRADGRGGSLDMSISKSSDSTAQVDITASGSGSAQTVTVLDSRRYLGLAANSNSALVTSALGGNKDWSAAMQPGSALTNAASMTSTGKVVNTLKIQLNPDNLGQVTATMRLSGDQLSVDLKVQTGEAYRQLHADQSHMVDALRAQGYQVDSITVSMAASGDQSSDSNRQSGFQGQSQQQSLMNQGQGGDARPKGQNYSGQQANGNDGNRSTGERGVEDGAAGYAQRLRSGDVYL
jgi:chemotaxis protein MotD